MRSVRQKPAPSRPPVLNPTLFDLMRLAFGPVKISMPGAHGVFHTPQFSAIRRRLESCLLDEGEYYQVSCPFCDDTRQRLYVNYLWGTPDPASGVPLRHLAVCYNADCLKEHYASFEESLCTHMDVPRREMFKRLHAIHPPEYSDAPAALGPVFLPGDVTPLDELPPDHYSVRYLRDRGFDPSELASDWGVGFCARANGSHRGAERRIIVPIVQDGVMVSWQGRWPSDDWKRDGVQKYYNLPGSRKSQVLYGLDNAAGFPCVIVTEGVTDAWATGDGAVAILGKTVSPQQQALLARWATKGHLLVLMLDPGAWTDEHVNREAAEQKHDILLGALNKSFDGKVVEVTLPPGRDPAKFARGPLRKLIRQQVRAAGHSPGRYDL